MKLSESIRSERGVSPVIGVILMVAITVILAAVIGSFVLGIGGDIQETPQASISVSADTSTDTVTLSHEGGDTLTNSDLKVTVDGNEFESGPGVTNLAPGETGDWTDDDSHSISDGSVIRVIHTPTGGQIIQAEV